MYDLALYVYLYTWIVIDHKVDEYMDYRRNVKFFREQKRTFR